MVQRSVNRRKKLKSSSLSSSSSASRSSLPGSAAPRLPVKEQLPTGIPHNGPPVWQRLPLDAKLPMVAGVKDNVVLSRRHALSSLFISVPNQPFDLSDPFNRHIPRYDSLHDPNVKAFLRWKNHYKVLQNQNLVTPKGHVVCSLRDFNEYRQYLHHIQSLQDDARFRKEIAKMRSQKEEEAERRRQRILRERDLGVNTIFARSVKLKKETELDERRKRYMKKQAEKDERVRRLLQDHTPQRPKQDELKLEWGANDSKQDKHVLELLDLRQQPYWSVDKSRACCDPDGGRITEHASEQQGRRQWLQRWQGQLQRLTEDDARRESERELFQRRVIERQKKTDLLWQRQQERLRKGKRVRPEQSHSPDSSVFSSPGLAHKHSSMAASTIPSNVVQSVSSLTKQLLKNVTSDKSGSQKHQSSRFLSLKAKEFLKKHQLYAEASADELSDEEIFIRHQKTNIYFRHHGHIINPRSYTQLLNQIFGKEKLPKSVNLETVTAFIVNWTEETACNEYLDVADGIWSALINIGLEGIQMRLQKCLRMNEYEWQLNSRDTEATRRIADKVTRNVFDYVGREIIDQVRPGKIPSAAVLQDTIIKTTDLISKEAWDLVNVVFQHRLSREKIYLWQMTLRSVAGQIGTQITLQLVAWMRDRMILWSIVDMAKLNTILNSIVMTLGSMVLGDTKTILLKVVLNLEIGSEDRSTKIMEDLLRMQNPLVQSILGWTESHVWHLLDQKRQMPSSKDIEHVVMDITKAALNVIYNQVHQKMQRIKPIQMELVVQFVLEGVLGRLQQRLLMQNICSNLDESFPRHFYLAGDIQRKASFITSLTMKAAQASIEKLKHGPTIHDRESKRVAKVISREIMDMTKHQSAVMLDPDVLTPHEHIEQDELILSNVLTYVLHIASQLAQSFVSRMILPSSKTLGESCLDVIEQIKFASQHELQKLYLLHQHDNSLFAPSSVQSLLTCVCHDLVLEIEYQQSKLLELLNTTSVHNVPVTHAMMMTLEIEYLNFIYKELLNVIENERDTNLKKQAETLSLRKSQLTAAVKKEQEWIMKAILRNIRYCWDDLVEANQVPSQINIDKMINEIVSIAAPAGINELSMRIRYLVENKQRNFDSAVVRIVEDLVGEMLFTICRELWVTGQLEKNQSRTLLPDVYSPTISATKLSRKGKVVKFISSEKLYEQQKSVKDEEMLPSVQMDLSHAIIAFAEEEANLLIHQTSSMAGNQNVLREVAFYIVEKALQANFPDDWCSIQGRVTVWNTPYFENILEGTVHILQEWENTQLDIPKLDDVLHTKSMNDFTTDSEATVFCNSPSLEILHEESITNEELLNLDNSVTINLKVEFKNLMHEFEIAVNAVVDNIVEAALKNQQAIRFRTQTVEKKDHELTAMKQRMYEVTSQLFRRIVFDALSSNENVKICPTSASNIQTCNISASDSCDFKKDTTKVIGSYISDIQTIVNSLVQLISNDNIKAKSHEDTSIVEMGNFESLRDSPEHTNLITDAPIENDDSSDKIPHDTLRIRSKYTNNWPGTIAYSVLDGILHKVVSFIYEKTQDISQSQLKVVMSASNTESLSVNEGIQSTIKGSSSDDDEKLSVSSSVQVKDNPMKILTEGSLEDILNFINERYVKNSAEWKHLKRNIFLTTSYEAIKFLSENTSNEAARLLQNLKDSNLELRDENETSNDDLDNSLPLEPPPSETGSDESLEFDDYDAGDRSHLSYNDWVADITAEDEQESVVYPAISEEQLTDLVSDLENQLESLIQGFECINATIKDTGEYLHHMNNLLTENTEQANLEAIQENRDVNSINNFEDQVVSPSQTSEKLESHANLKEFTSNESETSPTSRKDGSPKTANNHIIASENDSHQDLLGGISLKSVTSNLVHLACEHLRNMADNLRQRRTDQSGAQTHHARSDEATTRINKLSPQMFQKYYSLNALNANMEDTSVRNEIRSATSINSNHQSNQESKFLRNTVKSAFAEFIMRETAYQLHNQYLKTSREQEERNEITSAQDLQKIINESLLFYVVNALQQEVLIRQSVISTMEELVSNAKSEYVENMPSRESTDKISYVAITNVLRDTVEKLLGTVKKNFVIDSKRPRTNTPQIKFHMAQPMDQLINHCIDRIQEIVIKWVMSNTTVTKPAKASSGAFDKEAKKLTEEILTQVSLMKGEDQKSNSDMNLMLKHILSWISDKALSQNISHKDILPTNVDSLIKELIQKIRNEISLRIGPLPKHDQDHEREPYKKNSNPSIRPGILTSPSKVVLLPPNFTELEKNTGKEVVRFLKQKISSLAYDGRLFASTQLSMERVEQKDQFVAQAIEGVINILQDELQELTHGVRRRKEKRVKFDPVVLSKEIVMLKTQPLRQKSFAAQKPLPGISKKQSRTNRSSSIESKGHPHLSHDCNDESNTGFDIEKNSNSNFQRALEKPRTSRNLNRTQLNKIFLSAHQSQESNLEQIQSTDKTEVKKHNSEMPHSDTYNRDQNSLNDNLMQQEFLDSNEKKTSNNSTLKESQFSASSSRKRGPKSDAQSDPMFHMVSEKPTPLPTRKAELPAQNQRMHKEKKTDTTQYIPHSLATIVREENQSNTSIRKNDRGLEWRGESGSDLIPGPKPGREALWQGPTTNSFHQDSTSWQTQMESYEPAETASFTPTLDNIGDETLETNEQDQERLYSPIPEDGFVPSSSSSSTRRTNS